jgi:hypothetical protein
LAPLLLTPSTPPPSESLRRIALSGLEDVEEEAEELAAAAAAAAAAVS